MSFDTDQMPNAEDESHFATSPEKHLTYQSVPTNGLGDPDVADGISGPSFSDRPSKSAYRNLQTLSYPVLYTIPPRVLYDGHFQRLEPVFEKCRYILCSCTPDRSKLTKFRQPRILCHPINVRLAPESFPLSHGGLEKVRLPAARCASFGMSSYREFLLE